jgi:uncharacterized repeat protein (TIGR01451 family)
MLNLSAIVKAVRKPWGPGHCARASAPVYLRPLVENPAPWAHTPSSPRTGTRRARGPACALLLVFLLFASIAHAVPPGTVIENTARADFAANGVAMAQNSNTLSLTTSWPRTAAQGQLLQYAPSMTGATLQSIPTTDFDPDGAVGGATQPIAAVYPAGSTVAIDLSQPVPLTAATVYHQGEPLFFLVSDADQNTDPSAAEAVWVLVSAGGTGDSELLRLSETAPDSGIFVGYLQSSGLGVVQAFNGVLEVTENNSIQMLYTDTADTADTVTMTALVDPFGQVFDSGTGQPVDGVQLTLETSSGAPATVYGDDGVSAFPATVVSGGSQVDGSGKVYNFPSGAYRFPFVAPGTYRLRIEPPAGYNAPSGVPTSVLQALPGAPFVIAEPGSRGELFTLNPGPAVRMDIPVDPMLSGLWIRKSVGQTLAAVGDMVPYTLSVENSGGDTALAVAATDRLPPGFRYRRGSARLNGQTLTDPTISADGRTLQFALGDLADGATAEIRYVAQVGAGVRPGEARNMAWAASANGYGSNTASAVITIREELFRSHGLIAGRVVADNCDDLALPKDQKSSDGVAGVRLFLEDGTYVVTDDHGRYHFEGLSAGTHVVQLDQATIPEPYEITLCQDDSRWAGTAFSRFVDLQGGSLWRVNFHLQSKAPPQGEVHLQMACGLQEREVGYQVQIAAEQVALNNLRLSVMLPEGTRYVSGSSRSEEHPMNDPQQMGQALIYRLGDMAVPQEQWVYFKVRLLDEAQPGQLHTKTLLTFDTDGRKNQRTEVVDTVLALSRREERQVQPPLVVRPRFGVLSADLTPQDQAMLDRLTEKLQGLEIEHVVFAGHTDDRPIRPGGGHGFADNQSLSLARARTVADYLAARLNLSPACMTIVGKGATEPLASNANEGGRALNRRVTVAVMSVKVNWIHDIASIKCEGQVAAETLGAHTIAKPASPVVAPLAKLEPDADQIDMEALSPGFVWLAPAQGSYPHIPSVKVAISHGPGETIELLLNGQPVSGLNFDGQRKNGAGSVAASFWRGVDLVEGDNYFTAIRKEPGGREIDRLTHTIHYSGPPVKAELVPGDCYLVANGKDAPIIALRLTDQWGHPARFGIYGTYSIQPPYQAYETHDQLARLPAIDGPHEALRYAVDQDGMVRIALQPTTQSGRAVLSIPLGGHDQEISVWLQPEARDWILVGLAEATAGYNAASGNMENLTAAGQEEDFYQDGRLAFFAKGRIKGQWLLTAAYDSGRDRDDPQARLFQTIDPNTYYTLYGDASQQQYEAASIAKLYVKIERERFYALFGDMDTGLEVTELSRYSRRLNGFKSEYNGQRYGFNLFAADTRQAFVKDEIRGDGTSGLYRLSKTDIVVNSETVTIENRDRFHSEVIVSSQKLTRFVDYSIDYDAGTLFFKAPVYSRDENFNPTYIVVDYESRDQRDRDLTYGGRAAVRLMEQHMELGATAIHEGGQGAQGNLQGLDASLDLGRGVRIKAEVATSHKEQGADENDGNAVLAEITKQSANLDARVYLREQGQGFGLGQQAGSETATRKAGAEAAWRFAPSHTLAGEIYHNDNLDTDARRDVGEARLQYNQPSFSLSAGLRQAEDRFADGTLDRTTQVLAGASRRFLDNRLQLRANHEQSLGSTGSADFPTRSTLGADYQLTDHASLFGEHEMSWDDDGNSQSSRAGLKATPWTGGTLGSALGRESYADSERVFTTLGLFQTWQIDTHWLVDGGLDRSQTVARSQRPPFNTNVPATAGSSEDFTAVSLGAGYKNTTWSWTGRVEARYGQTQDKWSLISGIAGEVRPGLGMSAGLQLRDTDTHAADGTDSFEGDLCLSLAWRPDAGRWIVFERFDYKVDSQSGVTSESDGRRLVSNLNANYRPWADLQLALQYGAKYVWDSIDGSSYDGYTDLVGVETRYNITKRWDLGFQASVLHVWDLGQFDYRTGLSVGYAVYQNTWISLGYNLTGFSDEDFSAADFTAQGPYVKFRLKFDQQSVKQMVDWFGR